MSFALKDNDVSRFMLNLQIHNEKDNDREIEHLESLTERFEAGETDLEPLIDYLSSLIVDLEEKTYPLETADPVGILRHLMEQHGHRQSDLNDMASRTVISEILNGKRQLNLGHIRRLSQKYGVSPEVFI
ncbi:MAG: helix-turn-helix domain-containing protein [Spirochaetales bacterium]|nr:helix-turn-helix domain-containing protein [Spirochaetales bacterium]